MKNEHEKPTVPCISLAARLPRPWPSTEWRSRQSAGRKKKSKQTSKRDHPGPALSGGVGRTRKKNAGTKLPSPITQETLQSLTLKSPKHLKHPKEKISRRRKHQERPKEKTQIPRRRKHQEQPKEKSQITRRRNYQKKSKGKNPENRKTVERGGDVKVN